MSTAMRATVFLILLGLLLVAFARLWPTGADWYFTFYSTARAWIAGETRLYDATSAGFYLMPWSMFILAPLALLPVTWGQAVLSVVTTLEALLLATLAVSEKRPTLLVIILAMANLHTFDVLIRGNVDALPVLGLTLGWLGLQKRKPFLLGVGLWLLAVKPVNVILPALVLLWGMRQWTKREVVRTLLPLAVTFLLSFAVFGLDWPIRYVMMWQANPPLIYLQTSLWRAIKAVRLPRLIVYLLAIPACILALWQVGRRGATPATLALAATTNLLFTPYALGSHYVLLAVPFVILANWRRPVMLTWLLTLTPLLRLHFGFDIAWIDVGYPLVLWFISWAGLRRQKWMMT